MRPIQTCFRLGSGYYSLTWPLLISRRLILQQARGQGQYPSHCLSANGFMFYFTPLRGFYLTIPSRYYFAIGHPGVFSLTRWSSQIHTGFHVPHATRDQTIAYFFLTTGLSPSMVQDSAASSYHMAFILFRIFSRLPYKIYKGVKQT